MIQRRKLTVQLWTATILTIAGIVLLFAGFVVCPRGEIHNSVLIAFGELSTFAGALFGVDYSYRKQHFIQQQQNRKNKGTTTASPTSTTLNIQDDETY